MTGVRARLGRKKVAKVDTPGVTSWGADWGAV